MLLTLQWHAAQKEIIERAARGERGKKGVKPCGDLTQNKKQKKKKDGRCHLGKAVFRGNQHRQERKSKGESN